MAQTCAKCGAENPDEAYFCTTCSAQLRSALDTGGPGGTDIAPGQTATVLPSANRVQLPPPPGESAPIAAPSMETVSGSKFALRDEPAPQPASDGVQSSIPPPPPAAYPLPPVAYPPPPAAYAPPQATQNYVQPTVGYAPPPPDGNTSGMGSAYLAPHEAQGWTFAGCIPFGLFGFINGITTWGVIGLLGSVLPYVGSILGMVYAIYVGIKGKELAWQSRRFNSMQQYQDTMRAWNNWGIFLLVLNIVITIIAFIIFFSLGMSGFFDEGGFADTYSEPTV